MRYVTYLCLTDYVGGTKLHLKKNFIKMEGSLPMDKFDSVGTATFITGIFMCLQIHHMPVRQNQI